MLIDLIHRAFGPTAEVTVTIRVRQEDAGALDRVAIGEVIDMLHSAGFLWRIGEWREAEEPPPHRDEDE